MSTNKDPFTVIAKRNLARFGKLLFDNETNEILGRTCSDWARVGAFFSVFYTILAMIFAIHLAIFLAITPEPSEGRPPWNHGRYAYSNYPNRKIDLILTPKSFSVRVNETGFGSASLSDSDFNYMTRLQAGANASRVGAACLDRGNRYGFSSGVPCVYLHIAKVFDWTPELINSTLGDKPLLSINCTLSTDTSLNLQFSIDSQPIALPLNISNNDDSRSYPFRNQPNFRLPVMALMLNLTDLQSDLPSSFEGQITCLVDFDAMDIASPSNSDLQRSYEIPSKATTKIRFQS